MKITNQIVLGTMKLRKYYNNTEDLSAFLNYAHLKGLRQLHVSNEYDSYDLIVKSLKIINKKKFTFILKLAEPETDKLYFSLKRLKQKIKKYRQDLGKKNIFIVQLVNRHKCNNKRKYLSSEFKIFEEIQNTINRLKKNKHIQSFYYFPYHINSNKIKRYEYINGITCYRNIYENKNDDYAIQNNYKIIAMRPLGGVKKIVNKKNLKKLIMFNLSNKLVQKIIIGANNREQLDELLNLC